ncbi:MAG: 8-amino-7-oxononanoate synthase [Phycisphaeraceae bacterium]|nr:8-amino-7-oxononanoate synthase [Phycisphaeraceae bacterium]
MPYWLDEIRADLKQLERDNLLRTLKVVEVNGRTIRRNGRELINLAGNDYLGLSSHPRVRDAVIDAVRLYGTGAGASRLVSGHLPIHAQMETKFAAFKHAEAALILPSGYTANLAAVTALAQPGDLICVDKLNHASLIDAARASGAEVRVFPHLRYDKLERLLQRGPRTRTLLPTEINPSKTTFSTSSSSGEVASDELLTAATERTPRTFILTDSVFSMDGNTAQLPELCDLAEKYSSILMVDEAHGTGVLGETGGGLCELQGITSRVDVVISTASKALGGLGGIVTARREVIATLVNRARSFIFSTGVPPAQVAAIGAALDVLRDEPWRIRKIRELAVYLRSRLHNLGWGIPSPSSDPLTPATPIIPLIVGTPANALALSAQLEDNGFFAPAIRPPSVAPGASRVRLSLRADLEPDDIDRLCGLLKR